MISYAPLWETMKQQKVTKYVLRYKYKIGSATVKRLVDNDYVSTHTLNVLCKNLNCKLSDVAEYIPD